MPDRDYAIFSAMPSSPLSTCPLSNERTNSDYASPEDGAGRRFAAGISAQQADQDRPSSGQGSARPVTVTGCLTSAAAGGGTPSSADPSSRAGSGSQSGQFVLTNAMVSSGGSSGTGTSGTGAGGGASSTGAGAPPSSAGAGTGTASGGTKTGSSSGSGSSYRLTGGSDNLQQYVNSRVEVTGTLQGAGSSGSSTGAGTSATGTGRVPSRVRQGPAPDRPGGDRCRNRRGYRCRDGYGIRGFQHDGRKDRKRSGDANAARQLGQASLRQLLRRRPVVHGGPVDLRPARLFSISDGVLYSRQPRLHSTENLEECIGDPRPRT